MLRLIAHSIAAYAALTGTLPEPSLTSGTQQEPAAALEFIDTSIENGSPLWYEIVGNVVRINLIYDHERSSPNRAAGHVHFVLHGRPGASLTLEFRNLDNVWNGQPGSVAGELKTVAISDDGKAWRTVPTDSLPGNRVQLRVTMTASRLHVARMEPYRLSDLERLLDRIRSHRLVRIESIGHTVAGRQLQIVRIGDPAAANRVFVRARAHPWEAGSNWVAHGLIERLLTDDEESRRFLRSYSVSILPMANEDGVARGGTRFNLRGMDLNRGWDKPADPDAVTGERRARALARGRDRRGPQAAAGAGAAQRRQRPTAYQPAARSRPRSIPLADDDARGAAAPAHLVHRRHDEPGVPQQRHARRGLAAALRHRRGRARVQLQLD